mgnify:CR=1 FL=1
MFKILTLNNISPAGLDHFPRDDYEVASEIQHPDAILLRSHNMHDMDIPDSVNVIGRAGAGVNNIPVSAMTERGVPEADARRRCWLFDSRSLSIRKPWDRISLRTTSPG